MSIVNNTIRSRCLPLLATIRFVNRDVAASLARTTLFVAEAHRAIERHWSHQMYRLLQQPTVTDSSRMGQVGGLA